jgi:hypothetical protein
MQQLVSGGFEDFSKISVSSALRQIHGLAPKSIESKRSGDQPLGAGSSRRTVPSKQTAHDGVAPRFSLTSQNGAMQLRVEHPVREIMDKLESQLSEFVTANMRGAARIGLNVPPREQVQMAPVIEEMKGAFQALERISRERGDGFAPSLAVRKVASEASAAVEHVLIDLIATIRDGHLPDGDVPEVLHTLTTLRQALRQLTQHFDAVMLEVVQESGQLSAQPDGGKQKPAA